jgi:hypothetical protein
MRGVINDDKSSNSPNIKKAPLKKQTSLSDVNIKN